LSPSGGEKMSKHVVAGGDLYRLLDLFATLRAKAQARTGHSYRIVVIQEAGLDGFWIHRALEKEGIESHVVDPASIATSRRMKRAKTDRVDGEVLVRTLLAYKRGEPRVCSMARPPSPEEEDRRRVVRERKTLISERIRHSNRIKGLLLAQGIRNYEPLRRDRRALRTGDGRQMGDVQPHPGSTTALGARTALTTLNSRARERPTQHLGQERATRRGRLVCAALPFSPNAGSARMAPALVGVGGTGRQVRGRWCDRRLLRSAVRELFYVIARVCVRKNATGGTCPFSVVYADRRELGARSAVKPLFWCDDFFG
jgi:transposase